MKQVIHVCRHNAQTQCSDDCMSCTLSLRLLDLHVRSFAYSFSLAVLVSVLRQTTEQICTYMKQCFSPDFHIQGCTNNYLITSTGTNIDNCYQYSTFSDNGYRDQISICTYVHVHSVEGICLFFLKHPSNLTYNWFYIWYMIPKLSIFMAISGSFSCQVIITSSAIIGYWVH